MLFAIQCTGWQAASGTGNDAAPSKSPLIARYPRRAAFTLVEVLVAGVILAISISVIGTALSRSYSSQAEARDERQAALLADDLLTKIDMVGPARIASEGPRNGNSDTDDRFSWAVDIRNRPQGHLYQVNLTVSWKYGQQTKSIHVQTYLNDPPNSRDTTLKWRDL